jgi:hypothetical protein
MRRAIIVLHVPDSNTWDDFVSRISGFAANRNFRPELRSKMRIFARKRTKSDFVYNKIETIHSRASVFGSADCDVL